MDYAAIATHLEAIAAEFRKAATVAAAEWIEWPGGEQPEDTYGKVVDLTVNPACPVSMWTGPAAVGHWGVKGWYRISAEQPEA